MVIKDVIEGETDPIVIPLLEDSAALDGTGMTLLDVLITGTDGVAVTTTAKFAWSSQVGGTVAYSPGSTDFAATKSPYKVRVKVQDGNGKVRYYPNGASGEIKVRGPRQ